MVVWTVLWRSTLSFVTLLAIARILGNQQISQMTYFNYVLGIAIGNIAGGLAANLMEEPEIQFVALVAWGVFAYAASVAAIKNMGFRAVVEGEPVLVMKGGKILEKNMAKVHLNMNELLSLLRNQQVFDPGDVDIAILETNGNLSVLMKPERQMATRADLGLGGKQRQQQVPTEVVVDGQILDENLQAIGRDKDWLLDELKAQGISDVRRVSLAMIVPSGRVLVDTKPPRREQRHN